MSLEEFQSLILCCARILWGKATSFADCRASFFFVYLCQYPQGHIQNNIVLFSDSRWEMPLKRFFSCPEYQKTLTSLWGLFIPYLVSAFKKKKYVVNQWTMTWNLCSFSIGVLSILGNGTLLFVAYRKKSSLKPAEFFVVNLAISDLSMTISLFPFAIPSAFAHMWVAIQLLSPFIYCRLSTLPMSSSRSVKSWGRKRSRPH